MATIHVLDFDKLQVFEENASKIMLDYNGEILHAFETVRNRDRSGEELHVFRFQDKDSFDAYRNDERHESYSQLRAEAYSHVDIKLSTMLKVY